MKKLKKQKQKQKQKQNKMKKLILFTLKILKHLITYSLI